MNRRDFLKSAGALTLGLACPLATADQLKNKYDNPQYAETIDDMKQELNRLMAEFELDLESADSA